MKITELSQPLRAVVEAVNGELAAAKTEARDNALVEVSNILVYLTMTPTIPRKKLFQYVLTDFRRAAAKLPETSAIHKKINHFLNLQ